MIYFTFGDVVPHLVVLRVLHTVLGMNLASVLFVSLFLKL